MGFWRHASKPSRASHFEATPLSLLTIKTKALARRVATDFFTGALLRLLLILTLKCKNVFCGKLFLALNFFFDLTDLL